MAGKRRFPFHRGFRMKEPRAKAHRNLSSGKGSRKNRNQDWKHTQTHMVEGIVRGYSVRWRAFWRRGVPFSFFPLLALFVAGSGVPILYDVIIWWSSLLGSSSFSFPFIIRFVHRDAFFSFFSLSLCCFVSSEIIFCVSCFFSSLFLFYLLLFWFHSLYSYRQG